MPPSLSVIIVTYNAGAFIADCLASLVSQRPELPPGVIVVDNASSDATCALVRRTAPGAVLVASAENLGFAAANNVGIRKSKADLVLLLNPDTRMHPGALDALVRFLGEHPEAGVAGPKLLNADGTLQRTGVAFPSLWNVGAEIFGLDRLFPRSRIFGRHRRLYLDPELPAEPDYLQGSCLLVRRKVFDDVGLLDEQFFMYFEETDFCRRVRDGGWTVAYVPDAVVTHLGGSGSSRYTGARLRDFHRSFVRYLEKHEPPITRWLMRLLLVARALLRALILGLLALGDPRHAQVHRDRAHGYWQSAGIALGWNRL